MKLAVVAAGALLIGSALGPYDIDLFATAKAPAAQGHARLVFAQSPYGVGRTEGGHPRNAVRAEPPPHPRRRLLEVHVLAHLGAIRSRRSTRPSWL